VNGVDPVVPVRLPKKLLSQVDAWATAHDSESRSDAVRALLEQALSKK
jgi:metal-responsive CopG/Arc/MetJ family transcriptional regulator